MRLSTISEMSTLIVTGSPVAIGVSRGKDSQASALAVCEHLDRFGHRPRPGVAKLRHLEIDMRKTKKLAATPGRLMWVAGPICEGNSSLSLEASVVRGSHGGCYV